MWKSARKSKMWKSARKSKRVGEVAVMEVAEVGVRTAARSMAMEAANSMAAKRRKVGDAELRFSSSVMVLGNRREIDLTDNISNSPNNRCEIPVSDQLRELYEIHSSGKVVESCCSSHGSTDVERESLKFSDLEFSQEEIDEIETSANNSECRQRREKTPSSELQQESTELESTDKPAKAGIAMAGRMPSDGELEEFFAAAEKDLYDRFKEKYNFDLAKDVPLGGRFEWVRLKP